mgnify:CR=1 FL=1
MDIWQVITTAETRFILLLRDPAERAVSQLFEWEKMGLLKERKSKPIDAEYIHSMAVAQVK